MMTGMTWSGVALRSSDNWSYCSTSRCWRAIRISRSEHPVAGRADRLSVRGGLRRGQRWTDRIHTRSPERLPKPWRERLRARTGAIRDAGHRQRRSYELGLKMPRYITSPASGVVKVVVTAIRKDRRHYAVPRYVLAR